MTLSEHIQEKCLTREPRPFTAFPTSPRRPGSARRRVAPGSHGLQRTIRPEQSARLAPRAIPGEKN